MAQPLGPQNESPSPSRGPQPQQKKKGCKQQKCSHGKGGKCRCGKD